MTTTFRRIFRGSALAFSLLVILGATHSSARADEVTVSGSTTGALTAPGVLFTGSEFFTGTTALGIGSLSGVNSLGTFFVNTGPLSATSGLFQLDITFTTPTGILGGQGATYVATIVGSISPNVDQGGVNIHFLTPTQTFTFNDGVNTGSSGTGHAAVAGKRSHRSRGEAATAKECQTPAAGKIDLTSHQNSATNKAGGNTVGLFSLAAPVIS
jgi:hypothetical protein